MKMKRDESASRKIIPIPPLEEMLENAAEEAFQLTDEDRQWLNASSVGLEIINE